MSWLLKLKSIGLRREWTSKFERVQLPGFSPPIQMCLWGECLMDQKCQYMVWPPFAWCSATHLFCIVDCGLWNVDPLLFNGCAKLLDIGSKWNTLSHTPIQSIVHTRVKTLTLSMPIACSLKTCNICGIVLCNRTAHFRVAFYCDQARAHLCTNHTV